MRTLAAAAAAIVVLASGGPRPVAAAQVPTQDSVTGTAATGFGRSFVEFTFDVHGGPSGENPTGTIDFSGPFVNTGPLNVSCLTVSGNRASMVVLAPQPNLNPPGLVVSVEDNGPGQDRIDWYPVAVLPSGCPIPSAVSESTVSGDVTVTDAEPPATYAQCRQGGWVKYGYASHAQCNDGVHEYARNKCIFERAAIGIVAFRAKYGLGPTHDHAMRRCVRLYTGF
jgi:hypothetical protein